MEKLPRVRINHSPLKKKQPKQKTRTQSQSITCNTKVLFYETCYLMCMHLFRLYMYVYVSLDCVIQSVFYCGLAFKKFESH